CGLARVVVSPPTQPCTALHGAGILAGEAGRRHKQDIALALVMALPMVMAHLCVEPIPQGVFAKRYHRRQRCLCDRSDPVLREAIHKPSSPASPAACPPSAPPPR